MLKNNAQSAERRSSLKSLNKLTIGVVGSRKYYDEINVRLIVDAIPISLWPRQFEIISGGAGGVDSWAIDEAKELGLNYREIPADWQRYGRGAGIIRNKILAQQCDYIFIFWDGISPGTKSTIKLAKELNVPYRLIGEM